MAIVTSFDLDSHLTPAGDVALIFRDLSATFWNQPHLPAELIELCRLALAVMHKAEAESALSHPAASGLSPAKRSAVLAERWRKEAAFSPAEKSVLDFTEYYYVDPEAIPDDIASRVKDHFGDNGLVCLVEALGYIDSRIRLSLIYSTLSA